MIFKELQLDQNVVQQWKNEINSIMTTPITEMEIERTRRKLQDDTLDFFLTEAFGTFILEPQKSDERIAGVTLLGKFVQWCKSKPKLRLAKFISAHIIDHQNNEYDSKGTGPKATCKAGCGFCCYQQVLLTTGEYLLIKEYLEANRDTFVDWDLMKLHKGWKRNDQGSAWTHPVHSEKKCPFLKPDSLCSIYPVRPFACRNHRSIDDPKLCASHDRPDIRYLNFFPVALFLNAYAAADDLRPIAHYSWEGGK